MAWRRTEAYRKRLRRRRAADRRLRLYGIGAILVALGLLATLFVSLITTGASAFVQTHLRLELTVTPEQVSPDDPAKGNYRAIVRDALVGLFPEVTGHPSNASCSIWSAPARNSSSATRS
jgi:phosphate transport system permease protein